MNDYTNRVLQNLYVVDSSRLSRTRNELESNGRVMWKTFCADCAACNILSVLPCQFLYICPSTRLSLGWIFGYKDTYKHALESVHELHNDTKMNAQLQLFPLNEVHSSLKT